VGRVAAVGALDLFAQLGAFLRVELAAAGDALDDRLAEGVELSLPLARSL
jgi:hypothetical protein